MRFLFNLLFLLTLFSKVNSKSIWLGEWIASDKWQSEFTIIVNEDGSASSNYGSGEYGEWKLIDGNLKIFWESGKSFSGNQKIVFWESENVFFVLRKWFSDSAGDSF